MEQPAAAEAEAHGPGVLDADACLRVLERGTVGRLAFAAAGGPAIIPINYRLHRGDVVFRVEGGGRVEATVCAQPVALEVDELERAARAGLSVLVRGTAKMFPDGPRLARRGLLDLQPWAPGRRTSYFRIRDATVTGRLVTPDLPAAVWLG